MTDRKKSIKYKFSNYAKYFIKEIIPVTIGILIALYINNWNENRKNTNYINQISSSIDKELNETNEDIIDNIEIQKSLIDTLDFYEKNSKISILIAVKKAKGIHMPKIKINSWKAISNTKIELMSYNKVSALANIEEQKEILNTKIENLMKFIYSNTKETGIDKKQLLKLMMQDIISTEKTVQNEIYRIKRK
ncbi:hypothetical protein [Autumnicola musiva]|uniref:Chromosome segregation ATPase n=1 Tax=Autumnicola musiva TaxID=3075589 RepID=A0ABU3D4X5_9FLAO|nr:hypothetical protein [Zunongwangia sp. F117]MDT0676588.1 hypothetical protein [Zunongwangia sp. F117]